MSVEISVIVCTYTADRWDALQDAISSLKAQTATPRQIIVVVDHELPLLERVATELTDATALPSAGPPGLAGSRNTGARAATGSVVAFIDDDAIAEPDWLAQLAKPYADERVVAVGGAALPSWPHARPVWFPPEFDWVVGCSYRGLPTERTPVRNLIGANMSFRREVFEQLEFFPGLGRVRGRPLGGEETDFCIRLADAFPDRCIEYEPQARVHHRVTPERVRFAYFLQRCYSEGLSKGVLAHRVGSRAGLATERSYVRSVLPRAALDDLADVARTGRPWGAARLAASAAGVGAATSGYLLTRLRRRSSMSRNLASTMRT